MVIAANVLNASPSDTLSLARFNMSSSSGSDCVWRVEIEWDPLALASGLYVLSRGSFSQPELSFDSLFWRPAEVGSGARPGQKVEFRLSRSEGWVQVLPLEIPEKGRYVFMVDLENREFVYNVVN